MVVAILKLFRDGYDLMADGMLFEDMMVAGRNDDVYASTLADVIDCGTTGPTDVIDYILRYYIFKCNRFILVMFICATAAL